MLVAQLCPTLCGPMDCSPPGFSVHRILQARTLGVGCHSLLQGIFPTQGSNSSCLRYRQILYCLIHRGGPSEVTQIPGRTPWLLSSFSSPGTCCQHQPLQTVKPETVPFPQPQIQASHLLSTLSTHLASSTITILSIL